MKLVKMSMLSAVAAIAAMAFVGVSSATAMNTALCSSNESGALTCAAGNRLTGLHAVASDLVFLNPIANVLCTQSLIEFSLLGLAAPQVGHINQLTWTGCAAGGTPCTITNVAVGLLLFLKTAANLGEVAFDNTEFRIKCGFFIDCIYGEGVVLHLLGSELPSFDGSRSNGGLRGAETKLSSTGGATDGFLCPEEIEWDVFYAALTPIYVKT